MKFKNIFLITIILLAIFSIASVSAEDIANDDTLISSDADDDGVSLAIDEDSIIESSYVDIVDNEILANESGNGTDGNGTDGNGTDDNSTDNETGNVTKSIISSDLVKYYKNDTQFIATFLDQDGNLLVNQTVFLSINGAKYNRTTNASGMVKFSINLNPGEYKLTSTNPVTNESVVNNITVLTTMSGNNVTKYFKNGTQYYVTILDGQGNPAAETNVTFNINGVFYTRVTNSNGTARLNINLNSGTYTVTALNTLNNETISNKITVLPTISGKNIKKYYKNDTQYYANFTDAQGNPLKDTMVKFNINGVMYERKTDANGTAKLNINLEPGKYTLTAINPNTTEQYSNTVEVLNLISTKNSQSGGNVSIEYNTGAKYTVVVYYNNGTIASNVNLTFNIHGVLYNRVTDENGTASITINLQPGDYVITTYANDCTLSNTLKVRVTPSIKIVSTTVKSGGLFQFYLSEKNTGNPITGNHFGIFHFNVTTWGAYPDGNGLVSFTINFPAGNYLTYEGMLDDGYYSYYLNGNTIIVTE